ncbi:hypothetical protein PHMEG_00024157 [Phytophthora megakarya]|uniref:Calponin-homology (CH) domain-containing protein n=1 Tax=Phytophthora megakarya TaxID=4795 RepID=A0A225VHP1_9STRA|nr:hypothetical protein PHMEG_00024157 [Phytophthora megakarya]
MSAGKRRKFEFALSVFKNLGISPEAINAFQCLQRPGKQVLPKTIWCALDEVLNHVTCLVRTALSKTPNTVTMGKKSHGQKPPVSELGEKQSVIHIERQSTVRSHCLNSPQFRRKKNIEVDATLNGIKGYAPLKWIFPYITGEQMHVVNEWLIDVGYDVKKASGHGVLQDPMRNGVLLCTLLTQVLKVKPFSFCKAPRTLAEMKENISNAFENLHYVQVPPRYLTPCAEQAVLIGDRQVTYGILWHIWQASRAALKPVKTQENGGGSLVSFHEIRKAENVVSGRKPSTSVQSSPLVLDIPAIALVGQGKRVIKHDLASSYQIKLHDTFARRLARSENDPNDDDNNDDVFPKAPLSSPINNEEFDLVPTKPHENDMNTRNADDIWPTSSRSTVVPKSSRYQELDSGAPKIAIGELSGKKGKATVMTP